MQKTAGVLLMAYGSPERLADVESYYTHIRRGNPPDAAQLQELLRRYQAIGGGSPLSRITRLQAQALEQRLNSESGDKRYQVYIGYKHVAPSIADAVLQMAGDRIDEAVAIVMAPHYSRLSVGAYLESAQKEAAEHGIVLRQVNDWYRQESLNQALLERLAEAVAMFANIDKLRVVFSAHSLPERIAALGDPYPRQLQEHSRILAGQLGVKWEFAWQSAGRTPEPWLGPDILKVLGDLQRQGTQAVISCPIGFVADHLEVLYDLDIEAKGLADSMGMKFARTRSLNDDPLLVEALSNIIRFDHDD